MSDDNRTPDQENNELTDKELEQVEGGAFDLGLIDNSSSTKWRYPGTGGLRERVEKVIKIRK